MDECTTISIDLQQVRDSLYQTISDCQIRGLLYSCKWLGELAFALSKPLTNTSSSPDSCEKVFGQSFLSQTQTLSNIKEPQLLQAILFAKTLFDCREYDYSAHILAPHIKPELMFNADSTDAKHKANALAVFIYIYSQYMACEKRKANDEVELRRIFGQQKSHAQQRHPDPLALGYSKSTQIAVVRCARELASLRQEIEAILGIKEAKVPANCDAFVLYACGLVYARIGLRDVAIDFLIEAVNLYPTLWPAWYELIQLAENRKQVSGWKLPSAHDNWMFYVFQAKLCLKLNEGDRAMDILQCLSTSGFQESANVQADIALAYDILRDMDMAAKHFKQLYSAHPYRLDNVDTYSNVLFVREEAAELAHLAHRAVDLNKYAPETCCVVGNFHSLRGQHEKAVLYFHRALKLKPTYALVWTLIGHEFTELRSINAAVHAYRQAIAHNHHDFRAFYGLGQMYEILGLPSFALYYYREAQNLLPTDSRLIVALGEIYEKLHRLEEAKKCFWRAHCVGDIEGGALVRLASCFDQCGEMPEAAAAYTEFVKLCERNGVHNQTELAGAYKYLAHFHLQMRHYEDAATAANKCLEFPETREEAKALFRQITVLAGDVELVLLDKEEEVDPLSTSVSVPVSDVVGTDGQQQLQHSVTSCTPTVSGRGGAESSSNFGMEPYVLATNLQTAVADSQQPLDLSLGCLLARLGDSTSSGLPGQKVPDMACTGTGSELSAGQSGDGRRLWQFTDSLMAHTTTPERGDSNPVLVGGMPGLSTSSSCDPVESAPVLSERIALRVEEEVGHQHRETDRGSPAMHLSDSD